MSVLKREKFEIEVPVNASAHVLFDLINTPSGLQEWFADKVEEEGNEYSFYWDENVDIAEKIHTVPNKSVRYRWDYQNDNEYFELNIEQSPVTNEIMIKVIDFADAIDKESQIQLWETQIQNLKHRIGS